MIGKLNTRALCAATASIFVFAASPAWAGEIISAVGVQDSDPNDPISTSTTAGATVAVRTGSANTRAQTDYGVNRIYNSAAVDLDGESFASSVWGETFTALGSGLVGVSMSFTIDGSVDYGALPQGRDFNYYLTALRGAWGLSAANGYDDITAAQPLSNTSIIRGRPVTFNGNRSFELDSISNELVFFGVSADGITNETQRTREGDVFYFRTQIENPNDFRDNGFAQTSFHSTYYVAANGQVIPYSANAALRNTYASLLANDPVLGRTSLCPMGSGDVGADYGCASGDYPPTTLTLAFQIMGGEQFTLFSALMSENATEGVVDFFNTVRLDGITVNGGTLASDNPAFLMNDDGTYGFLPTVAAVPEPATWAMMIGGFGMIGGAVRRRRFRFAFA